MVRISHYSQAVNSSGHQIVEVSGTSGNVFVTDGLTHSKLDTLITEMGDVNLNTDAMEALQTSTNSKLDNIDTSLLGIDTSLQGTLIVEDTAVIDKLGDIDITLSGVATESTLNSVYSAIDSVDTSLQNTLTVEDNLVSGKLDGVNSNLSALATESTLTNLESSLQNIDSSLQGTLRVDPTGTTTQPVSGTVSTIVPTVSGTNNNLLDNQSVDSSYNSPGFDVSDCTRFSIMGNSTDNNSSIIVEFSPDNVNWYRGQYEIYVNWNDNDTPYDFYEGFENACVKYVRLNFSNYFSSSTVNCTVLKQ